MQRNGLHYSAAKWTPMDLPEMLAQGLGWRSFLCPTNSGSAHASLLNVDLRNKSARDREIYWSEQPSHLGNLCSTSSQKPIHLWACHPASAYHPFLKRLTGGWGRRQPFSSSQISEDMHWKHHHSPDKLIWTHWQVTTFYLLRLSTPLKHFRCICLMMNPPLRTGTNSESSSHLHSKFC